MDNLRQIAYSFAAILLAAIESGQIADNARLEFYWDPENGIDGRFAVYSDNKAEDGDINVE